MNRNSRIQELKNSRIEDCRRRPLTGDRIPETAYEERNVPLIFLKISPGFDPIRDDPRYKDLLRRMNLPE